MAMQKKGGMEDRNQRDGNKQPSADRDSSSNRVGNRSELERDRSGNQSDQGDNRNANRDRIPSHQEDRDDR